LLGISGKKSEIFLLKADRCDDPNSDFFVLTSPDSPIQKLLISSLIEMPSFYYGLAKRP
jgi:hypothetical protein